jgi:uncharacterized protein (TIGR02217 family)
MAFDDIRLRIDIEREAKGGPTFSTSIVTLSSGAEQRNQNWFRQRCVYDISYGVDTKDAYDDLLAFFYARRGRSRSFRFKDWSDFEFPLQAIGVGDGVDPGGGGPITGTTVFPLLKIYDDGVHSYARRITRPILSTLKVYVDGVETAYTWDFGTVVFATAPLAGLAITARCEFDVPVRFDTDTFPMTMVTDSVVQIEQLNLVEVME